MAEEKVVLNSPYGKVNNSITGMVPNGKTGKIIDQTKDLFCLSFDNHKGAYWVSKTWVHFLEGLEPPLDKFVPGQGVIVLEAEGARQGVVKAANPEGLSITCEYPDCYEVIPPEDMDKIKHALDYRRSKIQ